MKLLLFVLFLIYTQGENITKQSPEILDEIGPQLTIVYDPESSVVDLQPELPADPTTFACNCAAEQDCSYICGRNGYRFNCDPPSCYCYIQCPTTPPPACHNPDTACSTMCRSAGFTNATVCPTGPSTSRLQCTCYCVTP